MPISATFSRAKAKKHVSRPILRSYDHYIWVKALYVCTALCYTSRVTVSKIFAKSGVIFARERVEMVDPKKPPKIYYKPIVRAPVVKEDDAPDVRKELWQEVLSWAKTIIFTLLLAFAINNFVIVNARVPTGSMEDTIRVNDRVVAFRLSYLFRQPERFDVVVFRGPPGDTTLYVKRIIGLPGDRLLIVDGHVYINGSQVPERHDFVRGAFVGNHGVYNPDTGRLDPFVIPDGHFFVLGDYRTNSVDSRQWSETFIPRGRILGRVAFRYFPGFANLMNL